MKVRFLWVLWAWLKLTAWRSHRTSSLAPPGHAGHPDLIATKRLLLFRFRTCQPP